MYEALNNYHLHGSIPCAKHGRDMYPGGGWVLPYLGHRGTCLWTEYLFFGLAVLNWVFNSRGQGTPLYDLHGDVRPDRVWFSGCFVLNGVFCLKQGIAT